MFDIYSTEYLIRLCIHMIYCHYKYKIIRSLQCRQFTLYEKVINLTKATYLFKYISTHIIQSVSLNTLILSSLEKFT
jgi:hypothetical protein